MNQTRTFVTGLIAAGLPAGCASTEKTGAADKPKTDNAEYVRETPTGSWISRKVRKTPTDESATADSQRTLEDLRRHAAKSPSDNGG